jgi:hypothetical protein
MNMKRSLAISALSIVTALALLGASAPAFASSPSIAGYWVITQAAVESQGSAPAVVACGGFTISDVSLAANTFTGSISFSLTYPTTLPSGLGIPGINQGPETVVGSYMTLPVGALFVSLKGVSSVALSASLTSPSSTPHPSIDPSAGGTGCSPFLSPEFLGLVHLPMQGTEGMTIYGTPFTSV